MSALPPAEATALAVRFLEARRFTVVARNARGDSVYLSPGSGPFALRISNHARTPKQRRSHREVLTSLVIREPRSPVQVEAMVAAALRDFAAASARRSGSDADAA